MANHSSSQRLPDWLMLVIFLVIVAVLFFLGDTFTFVVGLLVMIGVFASGYNNNPANHEHQELNNIKKHIPKRMCFFIVRVLLLA